MQRKAKAKTRNTAQPSIAALFQRSPIANFLQPDSFLDQASKAALHCITKIAKGVGNFPDWHHVMHRLYVGSIAYSDYFKPDDGIGQTINNAVASMHLIMVRTHCIGADGFGTKVTELQRIIDALELIDRLMRHMYAVEVKESYKKAEWWINTFMEENQKASNKFHANQAALKELADEHSQVAHQPIAA